MKLTTVAGKRHVHKGAGIPPHLMDMRNESATCWFWWQLPVLWIGAPVWFYCLSTLLPSSQIFQTSLSLFSTLILHSVAHHFDVAFVQGLVWGENSARMAESPMLGKQLGESGCAYRAWSSKIKGLIKQWGGAKVGMRSRGMLLEGKICIKLYSLHH